MPQVPNFQIQSGQAPTTYANGVLMFYGPSDMTLAFYLGVASADPNDSTAPPQTQSYEVARVALSPQQAKVLLYTLQLNIANWEQTFGTINVSPELRHALGLSEEEG